MQYVIEYYIWAYSMNCNIFKYFQMGQDGAGYVLLYILHLCT